MSIIKLKPEELTLDAVVPWSVYTVEKSLLLKKGSTIKSPAALKILIEQGYYRGQTAEEERQEKQKLEQKEIVRLNPFSTVRGLAQQLDTGLRRILGKQCAFDSGEILQICQTMDLICEQDPDAALACIHVCRDFEYGILHPVHTAMLSNILGKHLNMGIEIRTALMAAGLTMNLGMFELQHILRKQSSPLTGEQRVGIQAHPLVGERLLRDVGVSDELWLRIVAQHHEKIDGSGYPDGLKGDDICTEAKLLMLTDIYSGLITPRENRALINAHEALQKMYQMGGKGLDSGLISHLIREIGVYPPGSFVKLINGEIAVVVKRPVKKQSKDSTVPAVASLVSPRGGMYDMPHQRDCSSPIFKIAGWAMTPLPRTVSLAGIWGYSEAS